MNDLNSKAIDDSRYLKVARNFIITFIISLLLIASLKNTIINLPIFYKVLIASIPMDIAGIIVIFLSTKYLVDKGQILKFLGISKKQFSFKLMLNASKIIILLYPLIMLLTLIAQLILTQFHISPSMNPVISILKEASDIKLTILLVILVVFIAPVCEEIIFRCVIFEGIKCLSSEKISVCCTSILFATLHQIPEQIPALIFLSIFLQKARKTTNALALSIYMHAIFNTISLLFLFILL